MMKAVCLKCFAEHMAYDEFDGEYIYGSEDRARVEEWIKGHKQKCDGKIALYFPGMVTQVE